MDLIETVHHQHQPSHHSPSIPTSPTLHLQYPSSTNTKETITTDGNMMKDTDSTRAMSLELLREQLKSANIPFTKRGSIQSEVPIKAEDCVFLPQTSHCSLELCADSCAELHAHHFTHQRPLDNTSTLIYSRPSVNHPGSGVVSTSVSPDISTNVSPQQNYRRGSGFGFTFLPRSSVTSMNSIGSAIATPHDIYLQSSPPSPLSNSNGDEDGCLTPISPIVSQPESPRNLNHNNEEKKMNHHIAPSTASEIVFNTAAASSSSSSSSSTATAAAPSTSIIHTLDNDYWRLGNHIINLSDYNPEIVGKNTEESLSRLDLAPVAREDFYDQSHPFFDCRSPQPPSPVHLKDAQLVRVNVNTQDQQRPGVEYELKSRPSSASKTK